MKRVVVIGSRSVGSKNDPREIVATLTGHADVQLVYWEDLKFIIRTGAVDIQSADGEALFSEQVDLVLALGWYKNGKDSYYRDIAYALALVLEARSIPYWNTEMGHQRSSTKLSMMVLLALNGIAVPTTYFSVNADILKNTPLQRPFIAKAISASRGNNNFLITDDAVALQAREAGVPMLLQPFLENDHDLRVICFGGVPRLVLKRSRQDQATTHLNNSSQGGETEWLDIHTMPDELLTFCEKIAKISGREMAGIDLIPDASSDVKYSCLEVNAIPQLTSGTDVARKLAALVDSLT